VEAALLNVLCVDVGSTFTKAALVDPDAGVLLARAAVPTTVRTDVLDGVRAARALMADGGHVLPEVEDREHTLLCSSAGGGLRLSVVGYEPTVTAEAGHRVGLSAGAKVVHVAGGELRRVGVTALRASRPDVVLLVGGTDGGNADVLLHNARRLATARLPAPVVVAGNVQARDEVMQTLHDAGRTVVAADNVLPRIGVVEPGSARAAIREVFLHHVIGGKGLSRGPLFESLVRAATPDAVLAGVEELGRALGEDVLVVDIGGATTDVYSVLTPEGEDATLRKHVVATLWHARTVEGDLGMRWSAATVLQAARAEHLPGADEPDLHAWVSLVVAEPARVPQSSEEQRLDLELARLAGLLAVRRHGRPASPGEAPRPLTNVAHLVGSGGVLRHAEPAAARQVLAGVLADHGGGWRPPDGARPAVDTAYLLCAVGLLAPEHPRTAEALAHQVVG
jgi:uncharacterized protein (TIGR01319 family)